MVANAVEVILGLKNGCNEDFGAIVSTDEISIQQLVSNASKALVEGHLSTSVRVIFSNLLQ